MIELYTTASPNGYKITIALEELGLPYKLHHIQINQQDNKKAQFLRLNPSGRIPVLVDRDVGLTLFESGAILLYLTEKTGKLLPLHLIDRWNTIQWLQFQSASVGPILGQKIHFEMFATTRIKPAIQRYRSLTHDLFTVMDQRLAEQPFLAGETYSIADIATFGWTHILRVSHQDFNQFKHLTNWHERIVCRPAVQRGVTLPEQATGP